MFNVIVFNYNENGDSACADFNFVHCEVYGL